MLSRDAAGQFIASAVSIDPGLQNDVGIQAVLYSLLVLMYMYYSSTVLMVLILVLGWKNTHTQSPYLIFD